MMKKVKKPALKIVGPSTGSGPSPLRKLGEHGTSLWQSVMLEYQIDDIGGIETLAQICAAKDRVEALRSQIDDDGEVVVVKGTPKPHPLLRDETQLRGFIVRGLAKLGLSVEAVKPMDRPPNRGYE